MSDPPKSGAVLRFKSLESYFVIAARDSVLASQLAEEIAGTHLAVYRGEAFTDLAELPSLTKSWYEALGAYVLRYCRDAWRTYAYQRAVDRGVAVVNDVMAHCFLQPSDTDPTVYVRMPPEKIRAIVAVLTTEILNAHRNALDGTISPSPAMVERLHADSKGTR